MLLHKNKCATLYARFMDRTLNIHIHTHTHTYIHIHVYNMYMTILL
jgi:hypothetical protein